MMYEVFCGCGVAHLYGWEHLIEERVCVVSLQELRAVSLVMVYGRVIEYFRHQFVIDFMPSRRVAHNPFRSLCAEQSQLRNNNFP